jgi:hypothetical protein
MLLLYAVYYTTKVQILKCIFFYSLAVENPLYDSLPSSSAQHTCDTIPLRASSPTASLISDSIAYCGRFPPPDRRLCPQCGDLLATCPHKDLHEAEVASVSSGSGIGGPASSTAASSVDQQQSLAALSFHTFHPRRGGGGALSNHDR